MPAGIGAGAYLAFCFETTMGTYLPPNTAGTVFVPIISESLHYVEDKYYSPQLRQSAVVADVKSGPYHVEGDIEMEVDVNYLPYFLYCTRHNIAKSGSGPYTYDFTPSAAGSASTASSGAVPRTASISVIRNGVGFGYGGCILNTMEFTIDAGILKCTFNVLGMSEQQPGALGTPAWVASLLFGADSHSIYVAASGANPTFGAADLTFNGFTFNANHNATAQNRINALRAASYVSFGETECTYTTELDFMNRTEYDNFKSAATRAIKLESCIGGSDFTAATSAVKLQVNKSVYDTYEVGVGGIGDLIMANVTGRIVQQSGGDPYKISVKSPVTIT